jgi:hypothetical protein
MSLGGAFLQRFGWKVDLFLFPSSCFEGGFGASKAASARACSAWQASWASDFDIFFLGVRPLLSQSTAYGHGAEFTSDAS